MSNPDRAGHESVEVIVKLLRAEDPLAQARLTTELMAAPGIESVKFQSGAVCVVYDPLLSSADEIEQLISRNGLELRGTEAVRNTPMDVFEDSRKKSGDPGGEQALTGG